MSTTLPGRLCAQESDNTHEFHVSCAMFLLRVHLFVLGGFVLLLLFLFSGEEVVVDGSAEHEGR